MFRTSLVHPQGDSCVCSLVRVTRTGVSGPVDRRVCSSLLATRLLTPMYAKHTILHIQLSPCG